jgi:hypothetical protein
MTTTNMTMHCWYGMGSTSVSDTWQEEICAPEVGAVVLVELIIDP